MKEERNKKIENVLLIIKNPNLFKIVVIPNIGLIIEMIKENIFNYDNYQLKDDCELKEYFDNIKGIYEIFLQTINNNECTPIILKGYIQFNFLNKLIYSFNSDISEERYYLMLILHKLYDKMVQRRKIIRNIIYNYLNYSVIQLKRINGALELLEVMASIIAGYAIPLRNEHIDFFKTIIVPLHNIKECNLFFEKLLRCAIWFLCKDANLSIILLENLLQCFPFKDFNVKSLFLDEIIEILEFCDIIKISPLVKKLCYTIVGCFSQLNLDLTEKALSFFNSEVFISIIKQYKNTSFNIIVPYICYFAEHPWDNNYQLSFAIIKNLLKSIDSIKYFESEKKIILPMNVKGQYSKFNFIKDNEYDIKLNSNEIGFNNNRTEKFNLKNSINDFLGNPNNKEIKEEFDEDFGICPITNDFMENPVLCPSGFYYEKSAILEWLKNHDTDPLTREKLTANMFVEDEEYKKKIQEYRKKYNK